MATSTFKVHVLTLEELVPLVPVDLRIEPEERARALLQRSCQCQPTTISIRSRSTNARHAALTWNRVQRDLPSDDG